jgi:hypothetical protein
VLYVRSWSEKPEITAGQLIEWLHITARAAAA